MKSAICLYHQDQVVGYKYVKMSQKDNILLTILSTSLHVDMCANVDRFQGCVLSLPGYAMSSFNEGQNVLA